MGRTLDITIDGSVATLTLDRPEVRNAFNAELIEDLTTACSTVGGRPDVRVVVLRGAGRTFCAGADVQWMRASLQLTQVDNVEDARRMSDMFAAIDGLPQAVIGRIQGAAVGGGMGLTAVCDIVVAADDAVFGFTEAKLGIIPAVISPFVIPKIGPGWARALYLTAERFGPELARAIGLVHWVVPAGDLDRVVREKIDEVLSSGPEAVTQAKRFIAEIEGVEMSERVDYTANRIAALRSSEEGQDGLRAFLEKRPPRWRVDE